MLNEQIFFGDNFDQIILPKTESFTEIFLNWLISYLYYPVLYFER